MATSKTGKTPRRVNYHQKASDPLQVFCRLRPLLASYEESCISVVSDTTIQLTPPQSSGARYYNNKEVQYVFKKIFTDESTQKQVYSEVAHPLVDSLLHGKNGLLFTYGVTGSGKTYTMTGTNSDGGIMPRCIDVIFNSIGKLQPARRYTFRPDKMNGFEVQSEADSMLQIQSNMMAELGKTPGTLKRNKCEPEIERVKDAAKIENIEEDNVFSVFVSYVEIYNNSAYDLLEDIPEGKSLNDRIQLNSRVIREDGDKNMYVHGVNEVEVRTPEEAFKLFSKGQARKKMAKTLCNKESSRSHSVFNVRLVQAPLDFQGEQVLQDKRAMLVSQLSLVDLAGSERSSRTEATSGARQIEAGNINNSLMNLRTCLEVLRENQQNNSNKLPPYRMCKLTHLFKSYFTGDGDVRMIVCANPRSEDYDETLAVMKFAEMSQEVKISKAVPTRLDFGLTPGRRKVNEASKKIEKVLNSEKKDFVFPSVPSIESGVLYNFGPPFPQFGGQSPEDSSQFKNLLVFLETRRQKELELVSDVKAKSHVTRSMVGSLELNHVAAVAERDALKTKLEAATKKAIESDTCVTSLKMQLESVNRAKDALSKELERKELLAEKFKLQKAKSEDKIKINKQKLNQKFHSKMKEQADTYEHKLRHSEKKTLNKMITIIDSQLPLESSISSTSSASSAPPRGQGWPPSSQAMNTRAATIARKENTPYNRPDKKTPVPTARRNVAVSNPRRRSRSAEPSKDWLHHQPVQTLETGTVFQPTGYKKRKSVTALTDVKDITSPKTAKYSLITQDQNSDGELETHLFKADVLPTVGGGAQVVFNDVETLKQSSPSCSPVKKRIAAFNARSCEDIQNRCAVGIEGHSRSPKK